MRKIQLGDVYRLDRGKNEHEVIGIMKEHDTILLHSVPFGQTDGVIREHELSMFQSLVKGPSWTLIRERKDTYTVTLDEDLFIL